jgi:hypothetical protein
MQYLSAILIKEQVLDGVGLVRPPTTLVASVQDSLTPRVNVCYQME